MSIYKRYCKESVDADGRLINFELCSTEHFNFGYDVVDVIAAQTPEQTALVWCNTDGEERRFSFHEISVLSNQAANVFLSAGIQRGDRVLVVLKRHFEYWFTAVALHKLGAVLVPVTHMLTVEDFRFRIRSSHAKAVVCTPKDGIPEKIREAVSAEGISCRLFTVQQKAEHFDNLTDQMEKASSALERYETKTTDPMLMYYTSGTTGNPKGVIHDFSYPLAHIITAVYWQMAEEGGLHFTVAETGWGKASWGKIYGQWLAGSAVMVYDFDNFEPGQLVDIINKYGVTSFCAPPTVYRYLVRKGLSFMPTLKHASTAGETLAPEIFREFTKQTGVPLREGYGQTETTLLLANFAGNEAVDGALGTPSPLFQIELKDRFGSPVPQGEIGEIVVAPRTSGQEGLFTGYLDSASEYRFAWRGGVYHTGDAAWQDEKGCFWFYSRFDDIIKTGGYRIGPYEIEKILMEEECIEECSVIGVPDRLRGQAIKACVVLAKGVTPTMQLANRIKNNCNRKLAEYKWIRMVEFVKALPKTVSGKVRQAELRKKSGEPGRILLSGESCGREMT